MAAQRSTILITWPGFETDGASTGRRLTEAGHRLRVAPRSIHRSAAEMVALLAGVDAAIVSTDPFDATVLASSTRLRVIARVGVGTDSIDLDAAARRGVAVCTTPGANTASTADHTVALMLAALRRVPQHDRAVRAGRWERTGPATGRELAGATVGLVGYGAIGRQVRRRLGGFAVRVLVHDPYLLDTPGIERTSLEELLAASDVVSLHLPLSEATRGLLDRRRLALMRPHAVLVNTARGGLVDEDALADALERGALRAAALDVLGAEPPGPSRLLALDNVVVTPHVAGLSEPSVREMTRLATDAVLAVLDGRVPHGLVETRRERRGGPGMTRLLPAGSEPVYLKRAPWHAPAAAAEVRARVSELLLAIERGGAAAVRRISTEIDGWSPPSFVLDGDQIARASAAVDPQLAAHIAFAQDQVRGFARAQLATLHELEVETLPGVVLGHRHLPVGAVGAYVPGGRYPMLASSFMTVAVAKVAGVGDVTACAPPRAGKGLDPAMVHAIATSGADRILCLGGVQALTAMAFGLCGAEPADMLVGPGNAYVAEAKRQLFGTVGVDLIAGPTEIAIIADDTADPGRVAADLLGQAEHGPTSPALLISTSQPTASAVLAAVEELLVTWPTREVAGAAWNAHGTVAVVDSDEAAMRLADRHAPEHLEVHVADDKLDDYHAGLRCYGALFLGAEATVAYGDKAVGTNHVLPTLGAARFTGGLWAGSFLRTCTYQRLTPAGTRAVAGAVAAISHAEGFAGHARTAELRLAAAERA